MTNAPLMPMATAVWLVENTTLTFKQIAEFCNLHEVEIQGIADGEVAKGIVGYNPIIAGQLTKEEIELSSKDQNRSLNLKTNEIFEDKADVVFAADGAYSAIRYNSMQKVDRFNFSQFYVEDGYKELLLPAGSMGEYQIEKNALHIWPRGRFMLIALPNEDGSFTCTLFMPYENHKYAFNDLDSDEKIDTFFKTVFPDFYNLMPNLIDNWHQNPLSSMSITRCYPWTVGKFALLGDSAHSTVPFYGQGMNAGFEDCFIMWKLYKKYDNWEDTFREFQIVRKPDGDALQDLSLDNYYVMRDHVADENFLLQKRIEAKIHENHPDKWVPLYTQVSFSNIRYSEAYNNGKRQEKIMQKIMKIPNIKEIWNSKEIEEKIISMI